MTGAGKRLPFVPRDNATVNINVGATTDRVQISVEKGDTDIRVANLGTAPVWIRFGNSTVVATTTTDMPVPAGAVEVLGIPPKSAALYVAAIAAGATGRIYFTPGEGL